mgnify:CR=1 FL=1
MLNSLFSNIPLIIQDTASVEGDMGMLWMLLSGILVFFMQAGFTLVESGMTASKNAVNIAMKNMLDICVGTLTYWLVGYSLMYGDTSNGWFFWSGLFQGDGADLFFQTMFAATAATIVSGAIAGRTKFSTYAIFTVVMTAIIYPIAGGWEWNGGWLNDTDGYFFNAEFIDFAGSSIVHGVGGFAALVGAYMVGPRIGKYVDGKVMPIPGHNLTLATLGVFILWLGWFGFNGGSELIISNVAEANAVSMVFVNTNLAAAGGVMGALILSKVMFGKSDLTMALNGAIGGLVSITAEPLAPTPGLGLIIGFIGGIIVVLSIIMLDKMKIDDPVGAISAHGTCGIWGLLAVTLTGGSLGAQIYGALMIFLWTFIVSLIFWSVIKMFFGLRVTEEEETDGVDISECGLEAYPEFSKASGAKPSVYPEQ